ncbi:MAG: DUF4129 domain-containing protein [Pyrinomonadaceae bacterium]|nr:DUF4129 domain-containing protein [Pyrinomonadaceae bacterium]
MHVRRSPFVRFFAAASVMLACAIAAFGADAADYKQRLLDTRAIVLDMLYESANATVDSEAGFDPEKVAAIRRLLPATETLETDLGTQPVSNAWLHSRLDQFVTETDYNKKLVVLSDIEERLSSLIWKLEEVETAKAAGPTKDEEKQKLSEILTRQEFQKPAEEGESLFQRWFNRLLEWIDSLFPDPEPVERRSTGMPGVALVVQIIVVVLLILLVAFGIYRLGTRLSPRTRRGKKKGEDDRVILGERIGADMDSQDVFAEAERLAREGDVRGAIRKGYIALLCELSDRKLIGLARHKTNRDYLRDVRKRGEIYDSVRGMTSSFEHHWYGSKPSGPEDWEQFRTAYREASARI